MTHNAQVALITGASRGIGEATARELARRGYALALAARSAGPLEALAAELSRAGAQALPIPTDLRDMEAIRRLARLALGQFGRVDALIHNAGIGGHSAVARLGEGAAAATIDTNLLGPIELTRLLLPHMLERRCGRIVFVASVAGHIGLPLSTTYSASKFGLRGFAHGLRREVAQRGVGVTIISPGFIKTEMTRWMGNLPLPGPEIVARAIADALDRPRREVFVPGYYRLAVWLEHVLPGVADLALRRRMR
ncbi:MAG TPA: SDR family NAD(P)-dependent oxidoreductase [Roseiflexaceae bacterium]|nr:SDR family NAD(P)-dependent oxidoreductase [Roseiflexaceae bacterium]